MPPPVLVALGDCNQVKQILVCTGGRRYIDDAVQLAGEIAVAIGSAITLLHVMAEPPAIYANLVRMEEDVDRLLASEIRARSQPARAKRKPREKWESQSKCASGTASALDQIFAEVREGEHDLIVTGTSQATGTFRHYIMGDLTRGILNRADCPVLVARAGKIVDDEDAEGRIFLPALPRFQRGEELPNEAVSGRSACMPERRRYAAAHAYERTFSFLFCSR